MSTQTITEFLEARIAEDEAVALAATPSPWTLYNRGVGWEIPELPEPHDGLTFVKNDAHYVAHNHPARVLAECAAKRAIVESFAAVGKRDLKGEPVLCGMYSALGDAVADLAAVYADHADYDKGWAL